jgi:hypothetical protein
VVGQGEDTGCVIRALAAGCMQRNANRTHAEREYK